MRERSAGAEKIGGSMGRGEIRVGSWAGVVRWERGGAMGSAVT